MSKGPQRVKEGEVTRVVEAALKAGLPIARVEVSPEDGRIIVIAGKPDDGQNSKAEETSADLRRLL